MAFVPAVPEAVAAGFTLADVLIALTAALGWAVCFGLLFAWNYTFGFVLNELADALSSVRVWKFHIPVGPIRGLDNSVQHALSAGISTFDHAMGLFFHWAGLLLAWMANFAMATAHDTLHLARWLTGDHLPKYVKWAVRAAFPLPWLVKVIGQEIAKALPHVGKVTRAIVHESTTVVERIPRALNRRLTRTEKLVGALAAAVAGLAGTIPLSPSFRSPGEIWRGLTRRTARLERRMHRVEALLGAAALAGVMANVLGVSARCLRSGNVGRAARSICGMDAGLLEDLLLGGTAIFGALSVVEFASELRAVEDDALKIIGGLVKEWPG